MKCMVEGCPEDATEVIGKNDEIHLCGSHKAAWGYFRVGFYRSRGISCDGLLHMKVWSEAMKEFLEYCRIEIVGRNQLIEGILEGK